MRFSTELLYNILSWNHLTYIAWLEKKTGRKTQDKILWNIIIIGYYTWYYL